MTYYIFNQLTQKMPHKGAKWLFWLVLLMPAWVLTGCDTFREDTRPTGANQGIRLRDDRYTTVVNRGVVVKPLANDVVASQSRFTIGVAAVGRITRIAGDSFQYQPRYNYIGLDSVPYQLYDGSNTYQGRIIIDVERGNDTCVLSTVTDRYDVVQAFTDFRIKPTLNDVNCDPVTILSFTQPANGALTTGATEELVYRANAGFIGQDSATYTIKDAQNRTAVGKMTWNVVPNTSCDASFAPKADTVYYAAGSSATITIPVNTLLSNDQRCAGDLSVASFAVLVDPAQGFLTYNASNVFWSPAGATSILTFRYNVTNADGRISRSATVYLMPR